MNDRYLFRAKRIENGEWVEGFYALIGKKHVIISKESEGYYTESVEERHGHEIVEVDPTTICQCTGIKDNNGKMIWENDVVELYDRNTDYKWRAVVLFGNPNCEYTWGWQLKPIVECETNTDILCWIYMEESGAFCEVIGNIFDEGSENIGKGAEEN